VTIYMLISQCYVFYFSNGMKRGVPVQEGIRKIQALSVIFGARCYHCRPSRSSGKTQWMWGDVSLVIHIPMRPNPDSRLRINQLLLAARSEERSEILYLTGWKSQVSHELARLGKPYIRP